MVFDKTFAQLIENSKEKTQKRQSTKERALGIIDKAYDECYPNHSIIYYKTGSLFDLVYDSYTLKIHRYLADPYEQEISIDLRFKHGFSFRIEYGISRLSDANESNSINNNTNNIAKNMYEFNERNSYDKKENKDAISEEIEHKTYTDIYTHPRWSKDKAGYKDIFTILNNTKSIEEARDISLDAFSCVLNATLQTGKDYYDIIMMQKNPEIIQIIKSQQDAQEEYQNLDKRLHASANLILSPLLLAKSKLEEESKEALRQIDNIYSTLKQGNK